MASKAVMRIAALALLLASVGVSGARQNAGAAVNPPAQGQPAGGAQAGGPARAQQPPPFTLMSKSITDGTFLATKYTCTAGATAVSPDLHWMNAPRDTASFVLIVHDMEPRPRKGVDDILHWMVWNIAPTATQLPEAISNSTRQLPDGSLQTNGNPGQGGNVGYRPPCPPAGPSHHYAFELFAVDQKLEASEATTRADVMKAIDGHIVAHAALIAPYHQ